MVERNMNVAASIPNSQHKENSKARIHSERKYIVLQHNSDEAGQPKLHLAS
jgi:hypothetical protein